MPSEQIAYLPFAEDDTTLMSIGAIAGETVDIPSILRFHHLRSSQYQSNPSLVTTKIEVGWVA